MREYRGQTLYAMPSQFLKELPEDDIEHVDLADGSASAAYGQWRGGSRAANDGWRDAGFEERPPKQLDALPQPAGSPSYAEGMMVKHAQYGLGRVTELSGYGKSQKIKVKFNQAGERTFVAEKAALAVVQK
jgi:DNA helicase-2/ATP-dependent DNA helicase PcrA